MQIQKFTFNNQVVEFEIALDSVMINATQMAKPFGKKVENFLRNQETKDFIASCIKKQTPRFVDIKEEKDVVISRQGLGTWMHRYLALRFASWLDADFSTWVIEIVDDILFGDYDEFRRSLKESAKRKCEIERIRNKYRKEDDFRRLEELETAERKAAYKRGKDNRNQLEIFQSEMYSISTS